MTNQQLGNYKTVDKYEITPLWYNGNYSQPCDYMSNFNCCALVLMSFSDKFLKRIKNLQEKTITIFAQRLRFNICDALRELVPFLQFKKHENRSWRSVTFSKVAGFSLQLF